MFKKIILFFVPILRYPSQANEGEYMCVEVWSSERQNNFAKLKRVHSGKTKLFKTTGLLETNAIYTVFQGDKLTPCSIKN